MRDHLTFYLNGERQRVTGDDARGTLAELLRRRCALPGTKVVCAEGDCGSCSVLIGRVEDGRLVYRSIASCIAQVVQLDATHVVTVEGLTPADGLNAFQESMVACQGAQCGFCTPGFVVAMQELTQNATDRGNTLDEHAVRRGLTGNLCRCTGYDAIVRAALATDPRALKSVDALYPPAPLADALSAAAAEPVRLTHGGAAFVKPTTVDGATAFLSETADADPPPTILAGGTDLGVGWNKRGDAPAALMHTGGIAALHELKEEDNTMVVGAATPLSVFEAALATRLPPFAEYLGWFGSPPIRNAGTLAGNLCTASPIGDTPPVLYVLGAEVELASAAGRRRLGVEDFQTGYRTTACRPDELVVAIHVPLPAADEQLVLYKVSRRKDLDISAFSAAFRIKQQNGRVERIRIALGGVGPTVLRLPEVEAALEGQPATRDAFAAAGEQAASLVTPMSDVRGSETYRRTLTRNLFLKLWHELNPPDPALTPLPAPTSTPAENAS